MITVTLRNGFGFDVEVVETLPIWVWEEGQDPATDDPSVGMFKGMTFSLPFFKIIVGDLV
jgi:hypothetical protein